MASSNPYTTTVFTAKQDSGNGVVNQPDLTRAESVKVGKSGQSAAIARLAHAISRLPNAPSSRGDGSHLFLP